MDNKNIPAPTNDIFTIEFGAMYEFVMTGGYKVTGKVIDVCDNGMVLSDGTRLVQEHIIMFKIV